ncbi:MAG: glycosyltransferase family 39 protein [Candidatus Obscuribacterales bacterium]|nr:glycosyltransferase family 39 protein [Candidatus Obscuribacterales bacterium]
MYHLPIARAFLEAHYLVPTPFLRYVVFNNFTNLLFVPLFAIGGDTAAQQLSVASFIFCGVGIYACLRRFNSENAGLIGLLTWSSSALFWDLGSTALVDMNLALMGLAGVFAGLKAFEASDSPQRNRYATLAGIYFGFTIASKLLGALLVVSFMATVNLANLATNRLQIARNKTDFLICVKMMLTIGLIIAPWLIRSSLVTGNPIWPFGEKIFGLGHLWSAFDYNSQADSLAATKGVARNAFNFFILPWLMSFSNNQFDKLTFTPFLAFGIYLGIPLLFVKGFRSTKIVFGTVFCFLLLWFVSTQQVRYLMVAAPVICVLAGAVLDRYLHAFAPSPKLRFLLVTISSIAVLIFGFEHIAYADMRANWARLPFDQTRRFEYLNSRLPMFTTMNTLSVLPKGKIYGLEIENLQFYSNGLMIGDWFGPARYEDFRLKKTTGETLYRHLRGLDVKYLVVNLNNTIHFELPTDSTFKQHFRNIYCDGKGAIYELQN